MLACYSDACNSDAYSEDKLMKCWQSWWECSSIKQNCVLVLYLKGAILQH